MVRLGAKEINEVSEYFTTEYMEFVHRVTRSFSLQLCVALALVFLL